VAGTEAGQRTFRVGRATSVEQTGEPCVRPKGFDLAEAWERISANVEEMRSPHHIEAIVDADLVMILRWMFDKQLTVMSPEPDDGDGDGPAARVTVRIGGQHIDRIAMRIAGFGSRITVIGPEAARVTLARVGQELVTAYQ
jgi:predicted DNA-binding transcriptional regulator YafY